MTSSPRLFVQILVGLLLTVVGLAAARWIAATTPPPPPAPPTVTPAVQVQWRLVNPETFSSQVEVHGNLRPKRAAVLAMSVGGEAREVWSLWRRGARVEQGQVLLTLDRDGIDAQLEGLLAQIAGAEASLAMGDEGLGATRILEGFATESHALAQSEQRRWEELASQGQGVPSARDAAQAQVLLMSSNLQQAQLAVRQGVLAVEASRASLSQAVAAWKGVSVQADHHTLRAPFAGILSADAPALGTWITPGLPVTEVLDDSTLSMLAFVPEAQAVGIPLGATAQIRAAVLGNSVLSGRVVGRSPRADPTTRSVALEIQLEGSFSRGTVSGFASATLILPPVEGAILLRRSEMIWEQGSPLALVIETRADGLLIAAARSLTLGRSSGGFTEILAGLVHQERLITGPLAALSPGSLVTLDGGAEASHQNGPADSESEEK